VVIIASRGPPHLAALADACSVHPSNATGTCDLLVAAGLADRPGRTRRDRRWWTVWCTAGWPPCSAGSPPPGGEPGDADLWAVGWTTESPGSTPGHDPVRGRPGGEQTGWRRPARRPVFL